MCTLAFYFKTFDGYPIVIAANRDEFLDRPATPPTILCEEPRVVGGKDLRAGGTWLGINAYGIVAGLLNRRADSPTDANLRSRGLLCLDALRRPTAAAAAEFVAGEGAADYNPFNLLIAGRDQAFVAYNRNRRMEVVRLEPGLHLLTNLNLNDFECPRISASFGRFAALAQEASIRRDPLSARGALAQILSDHELQLDPRSRRSNALCLHLDGYGTRSSSLIFVGAEDGNFRHYFAPGPPCRTAYEPAAIPVQPDSSR